VILAACAGGTSSSADNSGSHPAANAGADQEGKINTLFTLDASGSTGTNLSYTWTLTSVPSGATAVLSNVTSTHPTITPDTGGVYVAKLTVNDDSGGTSSDTVNITAGLLFPEYQPGVSSSCTWTYQWTHGSSAIFSTTSGTQTSINYLSGSLPARMIGMAQNITFLDFNDGSTFKILGLNTGGANTYIASDCNMTAPHPGWSYTIVYNGMVKDQRGTFFVEDGNPAHCTGPDNFQKILFTVQDVTIQGVLYHDAIFHWYLDLSFGFKNIDSCSSAFFTSRGIILPTSIQTGGKSLTSLDVYANGVGLIASGDIEANFGALNNFAELTSHTCN
jgi:hypothetical protein